MRLRAFPTLIMAFLAVAGWAAEPKYKLSDIQTPEEKARREKLGEGEPLDAPNKAELANEIAEEFYQKGQKSLLEGNLEQAEGYFDRVLILKPHHKGARDGIDTIMKAYEQPQVSTSTINPRIELIKNLELDLKNKINSGDLEGADEVADQILAVDPQHKGARQQQSLIHRQFFEMSLARADNREKAGDYQGAVDALHAALAYRKDPSLRPRLKDLQDKLNQANVEKSDKLYVEALAASQNGDTDRAIALCRQALGLNPANNQAQRMLARLSPKIPTVIK